jgi:hypothetical protein
MHILSYFNFAKAPSFYLLDAFIFCSNNKSPNYDIFKR